MMIQVPLPKSDMVTEDLIEKCERLIRLGTDVLKTQVVDLHHTSWVSAELFGEFRSSCLSYLRKVFGETHPYYREFNEKLTKPHKGAADWGIGIIRAAKNEIESGWFASLKGIASAEVFSGFLEMAEYLLDEGYKDASAVMIGGVLEQHLKELSAKNGIEASNSDKTGKVVHLTTASLNAELAKQEVYGKLDHKSVTAWLDLRNKAAHANYNEYNAEQVKKMCSGVREFVARTKG